MPKVNYNYRIDIEGLLKALGGAANIERKAKKARIDMVGYKAMRQWVRRKTLRSENLCDLLVVARLSGIDLDIHDFIVPIDNGT